MQSVCRAVRYAGVGSTPTLGSGSLPGFYFKKRGNMNKPVTDLLLVLGDFLIDNGVEDATIKWKDKGENAGTVIIKINKYKK
jgi:predicted nicotinamide N-methyase